MTWGNHYTREHDEYLVERREQEAHVRQINRQFDPSIMRREAEAKGWTLEHYRKYLKESGEWVGN